MTSPFGDGTFLPFEWLWQTTLCLAVGLGGSFLWLRRPARAHFVLLLGMVAALATPMLSLTVRHFDWGIFTPRIESRVSGGTPVPEPIRSRERQSPAISPPAQEPDSPPVTGPIPNTLNRRPFSWMSLLMWAWAALSGVMVVRLLLSLLRGIQVVNRATAAEDAAIHQAVTAAAAEMGLRRVPETCVSDDVIGPLIWCWQRCPALLLPRSAKERMSGSDWRAALRHELAHVKRKDHLALLVGEVLVCVVPWQPLGWWAKRRLSELSEEACDGYALVAGGSPKTYANLLVDLLPERQTALVLTTVPSRNNLERRIRNVFKAGTRDPKPGKRWACGITAAMVCVCIAVAFAQAQDAPALPLRGESGEMILGLGTLRAAVYSPDGKHIATAGSLGAFLWDAETGALLRTFLGHTGGVLSVAVSPDGTQVLTGSEDETAKLWDAETGQEIRTFRGHTDGLRSVAFSPDGTRVLTGSLDNTAKLWDAETGQEIRTFRGHTDSVWSVAFSPDGSRVLTGSDDQTAKLWDAETGQEIRTFRRHGIKIWSVAFSPDGSRVLTGSWDETAKLWDAETGQVIRTFRGHTDQVLSVAFSADGTRVLTGSSDGTARIWDISDLVTSTAVWEFLLY